MAVLLLGVTDVSQSPHVPEGPDLCSSCKHDLIMEEEA